MNSLVVLFTAVLGCSWIDSASLEPKVKILDYPYLASIEVDGKHLCSATIVDDYYVLTSSTCVQDLNVNTSSVYVRVGTNEIAFRGQDLKATEIYLNSNFWDSVSNDLAMVKVATSFEFDTRVSWANPNNDALDEDLEGVVLGWKDVSKARSEMVAGSAVVINTENCTAAYAGVYSVTSSQACVKPTIADGNTCLADLGAPFYLNEQIYGVVSYNPGCDSDLPIVLTAVGGSGVFIVEVLCELWKYL